MWRKSARLVYDWESDQSFLTGTETELQHPFSTVIYYLTCRHEQAIDYVIEQTPDPFPQIVKTRTGRNNENFWTMNAPNLSFLQVLQSVSHKCKKSLPWVLPKESIRFLCECIVNRLKRNLQSIIRHQVRKIQTRSSIALSKKIFRKQRRAVLVSKKASHILWKITRAVINHLSWYGAVFPHPFFCLQKQEFEYSDSHKVGASKHCSWTKSLVPKWLFQKGISKKLFAKADSSVDRIFVLSWYQALEFAEFIVG